MKTLNRKLDTEITKAQYKNVIWFYDFWSWLTESKAARKVLELANIHNNQQILEIACGTGIVFKQIVQKNPDGINVGIDLSPDMLKKAKRRLSKLQLGNYELNTGNALDLDFPDNSFDIVINNFMIDLMPEETFDKITSEFFRVLKNNGVLVISTFSIGQKKINRIWYWLAKYMPSLLTGCRPVSCSQNLLEAGFRIDSSFYLSQNTFPSEVIKATKIMIHV